MAKSTTFQIYNAYDKYDIEVNVTNGTERVSLGLRIHGQYKGIGGSMTPGVARALAADLVARADAVEANQHEQVRREIRAGLRCYDCGKMFRSTGQQRLAAEDTAQWDALEPEHTRCFQ